MVEVVHPVAWVAQTVVGRQEVRSSVVGGVVQQVSCADAVAALHDEGHTAFFRGPRGALGTVDVDVALSAVAKRPTVGMGPSAQGTVSLHHLVDVELRHLHHAQGLTVFHHDFFGGNDAHGQAAPVFHVAVVQGAQHVAAVRCVHEHLSPFGNAVRVKPQRHARCPLGSEGQTPHAVALLHRPRPVFDGIQGHLVFHAKPPRRFLVAVRHGVFRGKCRTVNGGHGHGFGTRALRPWRTSVGDLGRSLEGQAAQGQGHPKGLKSGHGFKIKGMRSTGFPPIPPTSAPWCHVGFRGRKSKGPRVCRQSWRGRGLQKNDAPPEAVAWGEGF